MKNRVVAEARNNWRGMVMAAIASAWIASAVIFVSPTKAEPPIRSVAGRYYNVKEQFHAKGDHVTDDTANIQAAIANANAENVDATIYFPVGHYKVAGAILNGIAQLILPERNLSTQGPITIAFVGETPPASNINWTDDAQPLTQSGAIIESDVVGTTGYEGIFGAVAPNGATWDSTGILVVFRNLTFRTRDNPHLTPLALQNVGCAVVENCQFDSGTAPASISEPTNIAYAVRMPKLSNFGQSRLINCDIVGYNIGANFAEHCVVDDIRAWLCGVGFYSQGGPQGVYIRKIQCVGCTGSIEFFDQPSRLLSTIELNRERTVFSGGRAWANCTVDVSDPGSNAIGVLNFNGVLSNSITPDAFRGDGASLKLRVIDLKTFTP